MKKSDIRTFGIIGGDKRQLFLANQFLTVVTMFCSADLTGLKVTVR